MAQQLAAAAQARPVDLLLAQRKLSRRTVLRNIAGVALVGGSLIPLTTSCGTAPSPPSTATQTPPSHALGTSLSTYRGHRSHVKAVAWSPDGKRLASGSDDQTVQVWQAQ
jgi:hypothetical protein